MATKRNRRVAGVTAKTSLRSHPKKPVGLAQTRNAPSGVARRSRPFDRAKMESGIRLFLEGCGVDVDDPLVRQTPDRVAEAWESELLDGYETSPSEVFGDLFEDPAPPSDEMVLVSSIDFHSMCPHHLLPYRGVANVAYLHGGNLVGFSRLARLVDSLAHRLVLQETLTREIADAICAGIGAPGAAVLLDAEQSCMTLRGEQRASSRVLTEAFAGEFVKKAELRERFLRRMGARVEKIERVES